jgi:DNA invertase Pin-like site-specific DNA recombinase
MKKICAMYLRDSKYGPTAAEQEGKIKSVADKIGCESPVSFEDADGTSNRSAFERLIGFVKRGEISTVIVASLDRIDTTNGSIEDFMQFIDMLAISGTRFVAVEDGVDTTATAGKFVGRALLGLGRSRRIVQGERIHHALAKSRAEGQPVGRPRRADYDKILELRKGGHSLQRIAEELGISRGAVQNCLRRMPDITT